MCLYTALPQSKRDLTISLISRKDNELMFNIPRGRHRRLPDRLHETILITKNGTGRNYIMLYQRTLYKTVFQQHDPNTL